MLTLSRVFLSLSTSFSSLQTEQQQEEGEEDDAGRKLAAFERKLAGNYISCSQCEAYNCFVDEEDQQEQAEGYIADDELAEYIANFGECADTGIVMYNNGEEINLKAGFICGSGNAKASSKNKGQGKGKGLHGSGGPEIALFLDDDCTVYYNDMDWYASTKGNMYYVDDVEEEGQQGRKLQDAVYLTGSQLDTIVEWVTEPWTDGISCEAWTEYDEWNEDGEEEEEDQNQEEEVEPNEICQQIMEADAVPLSTCGYENGEEQEEAEEEAEDEWEGNEYNFIAEYELTQNQVEDIQAVCTFYNTYDWEGYQGDIYMGETHYQPPESVSAWANVKELSTGAKVGIAALVLAVVGGIAFVALKKKKSADDYKLEPLHESKGTSA